MSKALIAGINQVAVDKGLDTEIIFEAIEAALISAYKRNYGSMANVSAEVERMTGVMRVFAEREVVEEIFNERTEITEEDARLIVPDVKLGDVVNVETQPKDFGRIAAQTAKQVILQRIREAERDTVYENFAHKIGEIINAQVRSVDVTSGAVTILLNEKHECLLMRDEQIPKERLRRGDYIKVYISDVQKSSRGPVIKLSRTHRTLLRRLMEQEIPEIRDGIVEIKSVSREPGARSKAAVFATLPGVDPVGSCVGMRGLRIQNIVNELAGEKIDVVEWNTDIHTYIANALSPAKVTSVLLDEKSSIKTAIVVVPDRQLSLAIGKAGQNARLAAKLTGWRIDIKSESEAHKEGLSKLMAERAKAPSRSGDLLSMAEQILRDEDHSTESDDLLRKAAQLVTGRDTTESEFSELEIPDTLDLGDFSFDSFDLDAPLEEQVTDFDSGNKIEWPELEPLDQIPSFNEEDEFAGLLESSKLDTDTKLAEELPEIITADMLRARMAQRKGMGQDEDGADDELSLADEREKSQSGDGSSVGTAEKSDKKTKRRKKRASFDEESLEDYY